MPTQHVGGVASSAVPARAPRPWRRLLGRRSRQRLVVDAIVVVFALLWLLRVYWMVKSSLQLPGDLLASPPKLLSWPATLEHYGSVLRDSSFWFALVMSVGAAVITVVVTTSVALFAALALARFGFRGRRTLIVMILVVQMIPAEALFISQYRMLDGWSLLNSVTGLSLLYIGGVLPFVIWMMRGYVAGIPEELEQAAMVDGCTRTGAFLRVTLPLLAPGLVSNGVFVFLPSWYEYTLALIILSHDTACTLPIWLHSF